MSVYFVISSVRSPESLWCAPVLTIIVVMDFYRTFVLVHFLQITNTHIPRLLFVNKKAYIKMDVCVLLCDVVVFSAVTLFNKRKMEAFKKMAAALIKGSMGDLT